MSEQLEQLRSALNANTNIGGVDPAFGSVEVNAKINSMIVDASPKFSEIRAVIPREDIGGQSSYIWNVRTTDNTSTVWGYSTSESGSNTNTPAQGAKVQLTAVAKSVRTDWEVEGFFKAASSSYYNAMADEVNNALGKHVDMEERQILSGDDTGAYGSATGFLGLKQIVNSFVTIGDTDTVFGVTRASGKTYMDAQVVDAATAVLTLPNLDAAITAQGKVQGKPGFFVVSYERADEINQLLQAQQRFAGTLNLEGGFTVATYQGIPIVKSRYADKNGAADTDTAMYLIAANNLVMKTLAETQNVMADLGRADAEGGYIKTYEVLVCKDLTKNVIIDDLAAL
jgi:hypothetical protein